MLTVLITLLFCPTTMFSAITLAAYREALPTECDADIDVVKTKLLHIEAKSRQDQQQQEIDLKRKRMLRIVDLSEVTVEKEVQSRIPFFNIGTFSDYRATAIQKILLARGKAIGSITYHYRFNHHYTSAYILGIGIQEKFRKKPMKYGLYLMKEVLKKMAADGIQEVNLTSRPEAIGFNEKCGFTLVNRKGFMTLTLAAQQSKF